MQQLRRHIDSETTVLDSLPSGMRAPGDGPMVEFFDQKTMEYCAIDNCCLCQAQGRKPSEDGVFPSCRRSFDYVSSTLTI